MKEKQEKRLAAAAVIVMSSIVLSRLTGFLRETTLSWKIGLSWAQSAYVAAFTVPDLMYTMLVGGTISAALIPFLSGAVEKGEEDKGWRAVSTFITVIFSAMVVFCILGIFFAPYIIPIVAPGFEDKSPMIKELTIKLTRILFPSVAFIMLAGMCNGVLNTYKKFAAAAYGPTIYNIGCTISIFLFAEENQRSMQLVAAGVALSAAVYFLFQLSFAAKYFKLFKPRFDFKDSGFITLVRQAVPSLLSSSITQLNVIVSIGFVSLVASDSAVAAFKNANTLWQLPYGIFAMGIGTAILPTLARKFSTGELGEYREILSKSLNSVLFLSIPSAAAFIVLAEPVVSAIFQWGGRFSSQQVPVVAEILRVFSTSMITQSVVATINRAFYAKIDTKTPLIAGAVSLALNFCFGWLFYKYTDLGASGMALSYSIISAINSAVLLVLLNRKVQGGILLNKLLAFLVRAIPSSLVMGAVLWLMEEMPVQADMKSEQLLFLALEIIVGACVYGVLMILAKSEEALYFYSAAKDRVIKIFGKKRIGDLKTR